MITAILRRYGLLMLLSMLLLSGCAGVQTFPNAVRAGDTAALAAGWKGDFARENITVVITDASGAQTTLPPGDPAVRAVINFYPDPLSSIVVADRTGVELTPYANTYASMINNNYTGRDRDWWQTVVFVDLPATLAPGTAEIAITNADGATAGSAVEILPATGAPTVFDSQTGPLSAVQLSSLERAVHYEIRFTGSSVPYAMELRFTHAPDVDHGGAGRAHVVNPRGEMKNLQWSDDGANLRVIVTPAGTASLARLVDFKFYVTGGIAGLQLVEVRAFDADGNSVPDIAATVHAGH